ncbi:MAG: Stp1/IreP family PP2C-type Ser/Thr phosphatase [Acidobacteria bacterium]|nr:Stp1/IreP family PP2C-type Ser/Thr phosphatase [Acidobacteriota bacterium]
MIEHVGISDVGCVRSSNEDAYIVEPELGLFVLADGMGGAQAGERASRLAIETIVQYVREAAPIKTLESLVQAVRTANHNILQQASLNPDLHGMGTTVVAVLLDVPLAHIASVGDSRAYLYRAGELQRITSDQTWVNEIGRSLGLTEEQIHTHPFRNVLTMAVGARERIEVRSYELRLEPGDLLLLSSDGLHGVIQDTGMAQVLAGNGSLAEKASRLVEQARDRGGPDNITAVLIRRTEQEA